MLRTLKHSPSAAGRRRRRVLPLPHSTHSRAHHSNSRFLFSPFLSITLLLPLTEGPRADHRGRCKHIIALNSVGFVPFSGGPAGLRIRPVTQVLLRIALSHSTLSFLYTCLRPAVNQGKEPPCFFFAFLRYGWGFGSEVPVLFIVAVKSIVELSIFPRLYFPPIFPASSPSAFDQKDFRRRGAGSPLCAPLVDGPRSLPPTLPTSSRLQPDRDFTVRSDDVLNKGFTRSCCE